MLMFSPFSAFLARQYLTNFLQRRVGLYATPNYTQTHTHTCLIVTELLSRIFCLFLLTHASPPRVVSIKNIKSQRILTEYFDEKLKHYQAVCPYYCLFKVMRVSRSFIYEKPTVLYSILISELEIGSLSLKSSILRDSMVMNPLRASFSHATM